MLYTLGDRAPQTAGDDWWVAPNAQVIGDVILETDASVWFNAVLRGDNEPLRIGKGSNVQDGSVLHADPGFPLTLEERVTIGHMVMLHGCTIGAGSLIGIGSIILNGARVGANSLVGAGALIPEGKEFPDGSVIMGAPGRVIRQVGDKEMAMMDHACQHYIDRYKRYKTEMKPVG
ncbi:MAG: gamma carbonic anhydrase family protein [Rhodospirillaceae bacterium]